MDNELQHYGVKGMKWGVRKNDKVVLRKGSTVQRISANKNEKNRGRTYISFKDIDNLQYEAMAGEDGLYWTGSGETPYGYKVKLKVTNDIIAPSYNETVEAFIKTVENTPIKDLATDIYGRKEDMRTPAQKKDYKKNTKEFIKNMKHLSVEEARDGAYLAYSKSLASSPVNQKKFFDELQRRGYNAVVDHNDAHEDFAEEPLIVFERSNNLKQVSATPITSRDKDKAWEKLYEYGY